MSRTTLPEKVRREILQKSDLIPPLPDVVIGLLAALNRPETEPRHLEEILRNDQVLVARMLAMVNSPFYGLNRKIRLVREAVMVLGFRGVRSLVLASSTAKLLQRDYSCHGHEPRGLWLHAVSVAAASKALATNCRMTPDEAEQLFVIGLLHDIGKLPLAVHLAATRRRSDPALPVTEFERSTIGIDHAEAGALITEHWGLSSDVPDLIAVHHGPAEGAGGRAAAVVRLADAFAHERGIGFLPGQAPAQPALASDLAALALSAQSWSSARDAMSGSVDEALVGFSGFGR